MIREWLRRNLLPTVNAGVAVTLLAFTAIAWGQAPPPGGPPGEAPPAEAPNYCSGKKIDRAADANCGESSSDCGFPVGEDHDCSMGESIVISPEPKPKYDCNGQIAQPTHNCRPKNESCGTRYGCKYKRVGIVDFCVQDDDVHADIPYESAWNASAPGAPNSQPCIPQ